jgi:hypothetical protein
MLAGVGEMGAKDLDAALAKYGVVAPDTKNPISPCFPFNLMFKTSIGPKGDLTGYLRPETAQVCGARDVAPESRAGEGGGSAVCCAPGGGAGESVFSGVPRVCGEGRGGCDL